MVRHSPSVLVLYEALFANFKLKLTLPFQLPLGLLTAAQGHPMLVELKNGETLNGHLVTCDTWMNLTLKEVVQTSPVRSPSRINSELGLSVWKWTSGE